MATQAKTIVEVTRRNDQGKNACRRLRASGLVPGNVYGLAVEPFSVSVPRRRVDEVLHLATGQNTVITLSMGEGAQTRDVMIRELQRDPLTDHVIHVDFLRLDPNRQVHVRIPVRLVGTPEGVKNENGILDFVHREVEVACLPSAIPEHLDVDVSGLHVNQHVSISDLTLAEGLTLLEDPATILAVVSITKAEETPAEAAETTAAAEPEVIKKGKEGEAEKGS